MVSTKIQKEILIVWALLIGASMWGMVWYPMRLLEQAGLSGLWLTLSIYLAALASITWKAGPSLRQLDITADGRDLLLLAVTAGWANTAFVLAILDGNIMRVLLLFYLSPLWTVLFGKLMLNEPLTKQSIATLILAMCGAVLMLWHETIGAPWPSGYADWMALSSGMAFAASNVMVRKLQKADLVAKLSVTWIGVIAVATILIAAKSDPVPLWSITMVAGSILLGVLGIAVMTFLVQYGVTHMPVQRSAVILLFELVAGAISQQLLTDEVLSAREWAGGVIIVAAAYFASRQQPQSI